MLEAHNLTLSVPGRVLLDRAHFKVGSRERVGIVGANGSGKTTLLRALAGLMATDGGTVSLAPGTIIGYLPQDASDLTGIAAGLFSELGYYWLNPKEYRAPATGATLSQLHHTLHELDLDSVDATTDLGTLSGGQLTRLLLAALMLSEANLLLLDEPTNHLDITGVRWLEQFLQGYDGAAVVVSHDRTLLNQVAGRIFALENAELKSYHGGYDAYKSAREREQEEEWQRYNQQQRWRERIEDQIRREKERARHMEASTIDFVILKKAKKGARQAKVRERRLERQMGSEEWLERPRSQWNVKLDFSTVAPSSQLVAEITDLVLGYGGHALCQPFSTRIMQSERIGIVGANGTGKSTLLRTLAGQQLPLSGDIRIGPSTRTGFLTQDQSSLDLDETPFSLVRRQAPLDEAAARGHLHFFLFGSDHVFTPVRQLSLGERQRLQLALLVLSGANLLLLDEPLNHLDTPARERLEEALVKFPGTSITVTHDRAFLEHTSTRIWVLTRGIVTVVEQGEEVLENIVIPS
ncbi:MAG: ATP-binding cassette domain-containing protein [Chloroflexi bacterium]|nr:ATP-binding cassette domain-containing protein [Chloroflexota bacterium]